MNCEDANQDYDSETPRGNGNLRRTYTNRIERGERDVDSGIG